MKRLLQRRWLRWLALALLLAAGALLWASPLRWWMIGWARGEVFYKGRPTSYWINQIQRYEMIDVDISGDLYFFHPRPSAIQKWLSEHVGTRLWDAPRSGHTAYLLDPPAIPLLTELLVREDTHVRLFAIQCLGGIGREARSAVPVIREIRRTTQEYLVFREASKALAYIDPEAAAEAEHDRSDSGQLWERRGGAP